MNDPAVSPFIDGVLTPSDGPSSFEVVNPSNGRPLLTIPEGTAGDADRAVVTARRSFEQARWHGMPPSSRKATLHRLADLIEENAGTLDALDAQEMGKPVSESFCNAAGAATLMRFYAEAVDKVCGDVFTSDQTSFVVQRRVPRGVVAAVVPWNFPSYNAVLKVAPALAAGNCVILKPSELSSRSALHLAALALEAGVPPGVFNVVPGAGKTVGKALALHSDVDMIAFTGSTVVGKLMFQYSGQSNMKFVMSECGGKSPQIVFNDGLNLDEVADRVAGFLVTNQGQICSVGSRLLVQRSVEKAMVQRVVSQLSKIQMGDALDPQTTFGPVASRQQCARVMEYIEGAASEGAQIATGGRQARRDSGGYFVEPTVFREVLPNSRLAREEVFGPVLAVLTFGDEAEAARLANITGYGLVSYIWTGQLGTGMRMMKAVRSSVLINSAVPTGEGAGHAQSHEPFGLSGTGAESGLAGMESYLHRQLAWFNH